MNAAAELELKQNNIVVLQPGRWVMGKIVSVMFGFSKDQLEKYRNQGQWLEGRHFRKNPVNRYVYNVEAINNWMEGK